MRRRLLAAAALAALLAPSASGAALRSADGAFELELPASWKSQGVPSGAEGEREVLRAFVPGALPEQALRVFRLDGPALAERDLTLLLRSEAGRLKGRGASTMPVNVYSLGGTIPTAFFSYRSPGGIGAEALLSLAGGSYRFEGRGITMATLLDGLDGLRLKAPDGRFVQPGAPAEEPAAAASAAPAAPPPAAPSPDASQGEGEAPAPFVREAETPRETVNRMVAEGMAEVRSMIRATERLKAGGRAVVGAFRWTYLLISPGPHRPPAPGLSGLRAAAAALAGALMIGPLLLLGGGLTRLTRIPWAEEARSMATSSYAGPGTHHPLREPLELKPVGFGLSKEYYVLQDGRLAYRLMWPRTRSAAVRLSFGLILLAAALLAPSLSGEPLGDLFMPVSSALLAALAARLLFRNAGLWGVVLNGQGKVLAVIERSSMTTLHEEIFVVLDGDRKPLAYFPRPRMGRWLRKEWWVCPTHEEYGAHVVESSILKSAARRLLGHLFVFRSSFVIREGEKPLGSFDRRGPLERARFELQVDRSPILPVIDPRAFLGLLALLSFVDRDPWHPSLRG